MSLRKRAAVLLSILALLIAAAAAGIAFLASLDYEDPHHPSVIKEAVEKFTAEASEQLREGESYEMVAFEGRTKGSDKDWLLVVLNPQNNEWKEGTGTEGLIAIGHLTGHTWQFKLPKDEGFDQWFEELPESLLSKELKESFRNEHVYDLELASQGTVRYSAQNSSGNAAGTTKPKLPYPAHQCYEINVLPGEGGHIAAWNAEEAMDFGMPPDSDVVAAEAGTVVGLKDNSSAGACDPDYKNDANYVAIRTASGAVDRYMHLEEGSVRKAGIRLRDKVQIGQLIGKSDTTGYACGAHLHIVREKLCGNKTCGSLPLDFAEFKGQKPVKYHAYCSDNYSPAERAAMKAETERRLRRAKEAKEKEQRRQDTNAIREVAVRFPALWSCGMTEGCDLENHPDRQLVTENILPQIDQKIELVGGPAKSAITITWEILSVELVDAQTAKVEGRLWGDTTRANGRRLIEHLHIFIRLIKKGNAWQMDSVERRCGYLTDLEGKEVQGDFSFEYCPF